MKTCVVYLLIAVGHWCYITRTCADLIEYIEAFKEFELLDFNQFVK